MRRLLPALQALALLPALGASPPARPDPATLAALAAADLRVQRVAERLLVAAAPLCDRKGSAPGLVLHNLDVYRGGWRTVARRVHRLDGRVAVEGVVAGSPAAAAGIDAGDRLVAIGGHGVVGGRDAVRRARLALVDAPRPVTLAIGRGSAVRHVRLDPPTACRASVAVSVTDRPYAASDRDTIIIPTALINIAGSDAQLAVAIAHEVAHLALGHVARLDAAGIPFDHRREAGPARALWARAEDEADRLSLDILALAGFDPCVAANYWRDLGAVIVAEGASAIYRPVADRERFLTVSCAAIVPGGAPPAFWRDRHRPFAR